MAIVERIYAHVRVDEDPAAADHARREAAAGDESWQRWLDEYERGEALILCLEVSLETGGEQPHVVQRHNSGVFVETSVHPPAVERQVSEVVSKDFPDFVRELRARGHDIDERDLWEMYVHVDLDESVRQSLARPRPDRRAGAATATRSDY